MYTISFKSLLTKIFFVKEQKIIIKFYNDPILYKMLIFLQQSGAA